MSSATFFIGWDVGGWNCDKNKTSRDAIVILDSALVIVGKPWRGNLRQLISEATTTDQWITRLFDLCGETAPDDAQVTLAIDTPLGFSAEFLGLVAGQEYVESMQSSATNRYLFRHTERYLFEHGLKPLSAIKDMIGSQATKGMHVLAKFARERRVCGVWTDGKSLTAIEAYPSACKNSETVNQLRANQLALDHTDKNDALTCALIAYLFAQQPNSLARPDDTVPDIEGWIWVPKDALEMMPA